MTQTRADMAAYIKEHKDCTLKDAEQSAFLWKDGGGKNCSKVFVVVEHIEFLKKSAGKEENL